MAGKVKLEFCPPQSLTAEQFRLLLLGCQFSGIGELALAERLVSNRWLAFATDGGMLAVEKGGSRLFVQSLAIEGFGFRMRKFRDVMDRLASDLGCDTVETTCYDPRLAKAMMRIRARPESWTMVWQVEGTADGQ